MGRPGHSHQGFGLYLGYCEGAAGLFEGHDVSFHSQLKKPILTKCLSTSNSTVSAFTASPSSSLELQALDLALDTPVHAYVFETQRPEKENQIVVWEEELRGMQKEDGVIHVPQTDSSG
ncbi:hypothetical protein FIBSPDRAFT_948410 [Athelia psychrophila]|uniref:Uncharacterized protein n=1 Tax=Athelia psychrophila TaxID=1759441 RepID=A0A166QS43_9AGAM|nr:hypothetical protein FIBSPDRAFT_948410 [Fibularhizoctonia sp. CBS 109695]